MPSQLWADIRQFHNTYDLTYEGQPRALPEDLSDFRISFLFEEANEYETAVLEGNLEKQLDALVDLVYVALGTAYLQGFQFERAWERVHKANMRKVKASEEAVKQGLARSVHDVIKPPGWTAPRLADLVGE